MTTMIEILLFDDAEELDFVGPWEVFTMAKSCGADFDVALVSRRVEWSGPENPPTACPVTAGGPPAC